MLSRNPKGMEFELEAVAFDIDGTIYPEWKFHLLLIPFILKNLHFMKSFGKVRRDIRQKQKKKTMLFYQISLMSRLACCLFI